VDAAAATAAHVQQDTIVKMSKADEAAMKAEI